MNPKHCNLRLSEQYVFRNVNLVKALCSISNLLESNVFKLQFLNKYIQQGSSNLFFKLLAPVKFIQKVKQVKYSQKKKFALGFVDFKLNLKECFINLLIAANSRSYKLVFEIQRNLSRYSPHTRLLNHFLNPSKKKKNRT